MVAPSQLSQGVDLALAIHREVEIGARAARGVFGRRDRVPRHVRQMIPHQEDLLVAAAGAVDAAGGITQDLEPFVVHVPIEIARAAFFQVVSLNAESKTTDD